MGYSDWSDAAFRRVSRDRRAASSAEIFRGDKSIDPLMDPRGIGIREARDSEHHPRSVPIIVAFDVTASMGDIPTRFAQSLLGTLMARLVEGGWVTDPQILFAAIGDAVSDRAPLQVGQFESGLEMDMWLTRIWLEGQGGDFPESYTLAHWFAAHHTATDHFEVRGRRGYLFTIGDASHKPLQPSHVRRTFGYAPDASTDSREVIAAAAERYELFHVLISRTDVPDRRAVDDWTGLLAERVLVLHHVDAICDLIGVAIGRMEGRVGDDEAATVLSAAGVAPAAIGDLISRIA